MTDWQIDSALLAAHNIARALGVVANAASWIGFALLLIAGGLLGSRSK